MTEQNRWRFDQYAARRRRPRAPGKRCAPSSACAPMLPGKPARHRKYRRLVYLDASAARRRLMGRLQRFPHHHAQRLLGEGAHNALLLVGDFFQHTLASRFIDGGAQFPFTRPQESIWEPFFDTAKEWFGGIFKDWLFGERTPPRPPRDLQSEASRSEPTQREQRQPGRQPTKEQLLELLKQKQEQQRQENRERE